MLLAFDIGGTVIKSGLLTNDGVLQCGKKTSNPIVTVGAAALLAQLVALVEEYRTERGDIAGIAVATAGIVDMADGSIAYANPASFPGYTGFSLADKLRQATGLPVTVGNDVNMAALGEYYRGAGAGSRDMVMITVGTGIGGAIISGGKLFVGRSGAAGEIGYLRLSDGKKLEDAASVTAMRKIYAALTGQALEEIDGALLVERYRQGDKAAITAIERGMSALAAGIAGLTAILDPDLFVIGGGIMESGELLISLLRAALAERELPEIFRRAELRRAALGNDAGLVGAGLYFQRRMGTDG